MVVTGRAKVSASSLTATPIVFSPTSRARILGIGLFPIVSENGVYPTRGSALPSTGRRGTAAPEILTNPPVHSIPQGDLYEQGAAPSVLEKRDLYDPIAPPITRI